MLSLALSLLVAAGGPCVQAEPDDVSLSDEVTGSATGAVIGGVLGGALVGAVSWGGLIVVAEQGALDNIDSTVSLGVVVGAAAVATFVGIGFGALIGADGVGGIAPSLIGAGVALPATIPGVLLVQHGLENPSDAGYEFVCTLAGGACLAGAGAVACGALGAAATVYAVEEPEPPVVLVPDAAPRARDHDDDGDDVGDPADAHVPIDSDQRF